MTLVHEHLYQSRDLSKINVSEYIHNLVYQIFQAYEIKARGVKFNVKVGPSSQLLDLLKPPKIMVFNEHEICNFLAYFKC